MTISPPSTVKEQIKLAMLLKDTILETYNPEVIILFGSLGRGDTDEFSDVDLLVVMKTEGDVNDLGNEISNYLDPISTHKHIIVQTPRDFFLKQDIPGTIVFSAIQEGRILFEKSDRQIMAPPIESYNARKREVLDQEYIQTAHEFLSKAESSLQNGNLFRCRDLMRFAAIRAIKGVFVDHDIHPPRGTDLVDLINQAKKLEPKLVRYMDPVFEINDYIPEINGTSGGPESSNMLQKTAEFVKHVITTYGIDYKMRTSYALKAER